VVQIIQSKHKRFSNII